jgi:hypothetical protein
MDLFVYLTGTGMRGCSTFTTTQLLSSVPEIPIHTQAIYSMLLALYICFTASGKHHLQRLTERAFAINGLTHIAFARTRSICTHALSLIDLQVTLLSIGSRFRKDSGCLSISTRRPFRLGRRQDTSETVHRRSWIRDLHRSQLASPQF